MTAITAVATDLNTGTLTIAQAVTAAVAIRDRDIGMIGEYTAACRPYAVYVSTTAQMFALALAMASLEEFSMASGYAMVVASLFLYPTHPTNRLGDVMAACAVGL